MERFARLAGLGAFGACAGLIALFAGLVWFTWPRPTGGIDTINAAVTWIAIAGVFAALVIFHVAIGRQLLRLGQGTHRRHPL